jgi:hypothetical protein
VDNEPLAHSARLPGGEPQYYANHISNVTNGARCRAEVMAAYHREPTIR